MIDQTPQKKIQAVLLDNLIFLNKISAQHNLKYAIVGGTLLGAVRHRGFIPWDDDIDVVMPRESYDHLMMLAEHDYGTMKISHYKNSANFPFPWIKIENSRLKVRETTVFRALTMGVFLDVFPLDNTFDRHHLRSIHTYLLRIARRLLAAKMGRFLKVHNNYDRRYMLYIFMRIIPKRSIIMLIDLFIRLPNKICSGKTVINHFGAYGPREIMEASIFDTLALYEFEGRLFYGPRDSDNYLTKIYGNYMQLPRPEDRVAHNLEIVDEKTSG